MRVLVSLGLILMLAACATPVSAPTATPVSLAAPTRAEVTTNASRPGETHAAETRIAESSPTSAPSPLQTGPRRPRGIYAVVDINTDINLHQKANPSIAPSELHAYFNNLYSSLLDNPAVSGLTLQVGWSRLNPRPPSSPQPYDWSWMDDAFSSVDTWNAQNPAKAPKTIQVRVFPGFFTPPWVLDQIPNCDGLFQSPPQTPASNCGKATFVDFVEPHSGLTVLPMPWNAFYKSSFRECCRIRGERG
jgi:hypothetical protein